VILPGEDPDAYDELSQKYMDECQPDGEEELFCVTEMINAQWRLRRVEDAEYRLLSTDPDAITNGGIEKLERYRTSITRAFYRASQQLARLRKEADQERRQYIKDETAKLDAELKAYIFAPMPTAMASNGKIASSCENLAIDPGAAAATPRNTEKQSQPTQTARHDRSPKVA
jgi:hypothetical protein